MADRTRVSAQNLTRRSFLLTAGMVALAPRVRAAADDGFLDDLEQTTLRYFTECAHPETGLVKDRNQADGPDPRTLASIAATGFGLTALCIGDSRGWVPDAQDRIRRTLATLVSKVPNERGWMPHFMNWATGQRAGHSEFSTIDTAICLAGVITAREHFSGDAVIRANADTLLDRIDWRWMLDDRKFMRHGWTPEGGLMKYHYGDYCEALMLYLLGLGASRDPLPVESWAALDRPEIEYAGIRYIGTKAPLFVHQYPQAWFDFRGKHDAFADYFENSVAATRAHRAWCRELGAEWPRFDDELWGISASDSAHGYVAWGGPPRHKAIDGTLVPCAAGGSLVFTPQESLNCLRAMKKQFGDRVWKRYGFIDAFNPGTSWFAPDVLGIDAGITLLMAENLRSKFVWKTFAQAPEVIHGLERAGLK